MEKLSELGYKDGMEIELDEDLGNKIFLFYLKIINILMRLVGLKEFLNR